MRISMTFDCADARAQARFWATALNYEEAPPPEGWTNWDDWLRDNDVPETEWNDGAWLRDPEGVRPAISFLKVPRAEDGEEPDPYRPAGLRRPAPRRPRGQRVLRCLRSVDPQ